MLKREFTVTDEYRYNRATPTRWIVSHLARYKFRVLGFMVAAVLANIFNASVPALTGVAFNAVSNRSNAQLLMVVFALLIVIALTGVTDLTARLSAEVLGKRFARDSRDELYLSLLSKSQTFHNRQRVGDVMARASNDITQLSDMVVPGFDIIFDSFTALVVPMVFIVFINPQLLLAPLVFVVFFLIALRGYSRRLNPVSDSMREQFGTMNAVLNEAVSGVEVVKATGQEEQEQRKFHLNASLYRDYFVKNGQIQGRYLPTLLAAIALAGAFLHGLYLLAQHQLTVGGLVSYMGLMAIIRFPAFMSIWSFSLVQLGVAGAERILTLMREETELDENEGGNREEMRGDIVFENVTFSYGTTPVLKKCFLPCQAGADHRHRWTNRFRQKHDDKACQSYL